MCTAQRQSKTEMKTIDLHLKSDQVNFQTGGQTLLNHQKWRSGASRELGDADQNPILLVFI